MTPLSLDLARRIVREACEDAGVTLVTPDSAELLRLAVHLSAAAASSLTLPEVRAEVSVYVPRLVSDVIDLLPSAIGGVVDLDAPAVIVSQTAWDDAALLIGTVAHELNHDRRDDAVRARALVPVVGSALWAVTYLAHPMVRAWEEGVSYHADLVVLVVLRGVDPITAGNAVRESLKHYRLDAAALALANDAIDSAVASLLAGELPGAGTTIHAMLRRLVAAGWEPPAQWARAIGGEA